MSVKDYISGVRNQIFSSLTPALNADIKNNYKPALDFALRKSPDNTIRNIAITGGYGSGKSSIIGTYFNNHNSLNYKYLSVSLASFSEGIALQSQPEEEFEVNRNERLRQIELSILQQIFYSEDSKNIPDSNIKRIRSLTNGVKTLYSLCLLTVLIYIVNSIFPNFFLSIDYDFIINGLSIKNSDNIFETIKQIIITIIFFFGIFKSIGFLFQLKISSFKFIDTELKFEDSKNKSFFNQYIDEIIYFFESTKKNILIIEDLDRFQQTEIFIKLREINLLINQSKKIKAPVFFIYAVRDEIFKLELERTKFFDFIIPVIPIINPSNSIDLLKKKSKEIDANFSDDLLDSIAIFIGDMRLLNNIINEFLIFRSKLQGEIIDDKLLAIILYKNLNPIDYTDLLHQKGVLYKLLNTRDQLILDKRNQYSSNLKNNEEVIQKAESDYLLDVRDLRRIYLSKYFELYIGLIYLSINNQNKNFKQLVESENFYSELNSNLIGIVNRGHQQQSIGIKKISELENEISEYGYLEREAFILKNKKKKVNALKIQNSVLKRKLIELDHKSTSSLLDRTRFDLLDLPLNDNLSNLVYVLVKNNYIDEDYIYYISHFYDESLTRNDYEFLLNVKSGKSKDIAYSLSNKSTLLKKLSITDFQTTAILNIDLLEFMLESSIHNKFDKIEIKLRAFFKNFKSESEKSQHFLFIFLGGTKYKKEFINNLFSRWKEGWSELVGVIKPGNEENLNQLFDYTIRYLDPENFQNFVDDEIYNYRISDKSNFLEIISDPVRALEIVKNLKPVFFKLNFDKKYSIVYDKILSNNFYMPTIEMIELFLKNANSYNENNFKNKNYTSILNSEVDFLIRNIESNLFNYLNNEYLELKNPQTENEENLIKIYNSEAFNRDLSNEAKLKIINKSLTFISDISLISDHKLKVLLLENIKVIPRWGNLYNIFKNIPESIDSIVKYLNILHEDELIKICESNTENDETFRKLIIQILHSSKLNLNVFKEIINRLEFDYSLIDLHSLEKENLELLIDCDNLELNSQFYQSLLEINLEYVIRYIKKHRMEFLQNRNQFPITIKLFPKLMQGDSWLDQDVQLLLNEFTEEEILSDVESTKSIYKLLTDRNELQISISFLIHLITSSHITNEESMELFNAKFKSIGSEQFDRILSRYGENFVKLLHPNEKLIFDKDANIEEMIQNLKNSIQLEEIKVKKDKIEVKTRNI